MRSRTVFAAFLVLALSAGVLIGLAAPRGVDATKASPSAAADIEEALARVAQREAWLAEVVTASVSGRLEGAEIAILVADGASAADVDKVTTALKDAGATVALEAALSADWWTPELGAYRGEIADQVADSVIGAEGLPSTDVLQHAIVQALVPDAVPAGAEAPGDVGVEFPDDGVAADRTAVLFEVLTRSDLLAVSEAATGPVDALVIVTAQGPEGGGTMAGLAASVWEQYVSATLVVVFDNGEAPTVATEAITHGATVAITDRPSVVVATEESLMPAQVVLALVEQRDGGSGAYGAAQELALIAKP
ncbi:copper transporter [Demequina sp.]|uniref:copper transporter n=1 Tax=Demequina sp. TaxID=2050685 RepID=UPI0025C07AFA|nr:copper transporter [Demequina sp.]